ncbi:hypothetical protein [Maribacter sp. 2-571]|uniref:hypothetical protein n=1 Tax=Maribacter sp. 2-571 TaxID=3417569 RepID=UPI003D34666D
MNLLRYLGFLLTSTNRHGVHSPFVYKLVTQCIHDGTRFFLQKRKSLLVLKKTIAYFKPQQLYFYGGDPQLALKYGATTSELEKGNEPYDLAFVDAATLARPNAMDHLKAYAHNNSVLLIDSIQATREHRVFWEKLKIDPRVTVTVDLFFCGFVFFRKEQAKEHFKIRI